MEAAITYKKPFGGVIPAGIFLVYLLLICKLFSGFLVWNSELICGLLLTPYICKIERGQLSNRFFLPAVICMVVSFLVPAKTPLLFAFLFAGLLVVENYRGKVNTAFFLLLLLCSPIFSYITELIGFPIRLWLSHVLAAILMSFGKSATATGNIISLDGAEFSVDPACAGLNMLAISLIICLFMLAHWQHLMARRLHLVYILGLLALTFGLNILCNLLRILVLITFNIAPGNVFHDIIGLICLALYVILPMYFFVRIAYRYLSQPEPGLRDKRLLFTKGVAIRYLPMHLVFLTLLCLMSARVRQGKAANAPALAFNIAGYHRTILESGVIKFEGGKSLIYIKPTPFYGLAHDPMICWTGSGYTFQQVRQDTINGIPIYTGALTKGQDKIYAAWWFQNGRMKTINQFNWRWRVLKGEPEFYLVNVNAASEAALKEKLMTMGFEGAKDEAK